MTETAGQVLEHDHHRIDERFADFARSLAGAVPDTAAFTEAADALRHHIYVEEEHHFPVLRAAGMMAPVLVMLREHGEMWDLLDTIADALAAGDTDTARASWPTLAETIEQHNAKEERILYPAGDNALADDVAAEVISTLTTGTAPDGWVCEMAGRGHG